MYYDLAFMDYGKEFTSAKLTDAMAKTSFPVLNWDLKINARRHINIAFKRKLCSKSYALLTDEESMSPAHALQSGHSVQTENRIYGLTSDSLIGATEDIMQVFLEASTEWQRIFGIVPGGVLLRFHQATMDRYSSLHTRGHLSSFMLSEHPLLSHPPLYHVSLHWLHLQQQSLTMQSLKSLNSKRQEMMQLWVCLETLQIK